MQAELEEQLTTEESPNRKNGSTRKTMKSPAGEFELNTPRDRAGTFAPQIVKKHQTHLIDELERKVIALFTLGNSYQDIRTHIADMYDISLSNGTINAVTDKLLPELQAPGVSATWRPSTPSSGWMRSITRSRKWPLPQQSHLHPAGADGRRQKRTAGSVSLRSGRRPSLAERADRPV